MTGLKIVITALILGAVWLSYHMASRFDDDWDIRLAQTFLNFLFLLAALALMGLIGTGLFYLWGL